VKRRKSECDERGEGGRGGGVEGKLAQTAFLSRLARSWSTQNDADPVQRTAGQLRVTKNAFSSPFPTFPLRLLHLERHAVVDLYGEGEGVLVRRYVGNRGKQRNVESGRRRKRANLVVAKGDAGTAK
jgi:hypothetical protein